eukprot:gene16657-22909_t
MSQSPFASFAASGSTQAPTGGEISAGPAKPSVTIPPSERMQSPAPDVYRTTTISDLAFWDFGTKGSWLSWGSKNTSAESSKLPDTRAPLSPGVPPPGGTITSWLFGPKST